MPRAVSETGQLSGGMRWCEDRQLKEGQPELGKEREKRNMNDQQGGRETG